MSRSLSREERVEIRARVAAGAARVDVAAELGVSVDTVRHYAAEAVPCIRCGCPTGRQGLCVFCRRDDRTCVCGGRKASTSRVCLRCRAGVSDDGQARCRGACGRWRPFAEFRRRRMSRYRPVAGECRECESRSATRRGGSTRAVRNAIYRAVRSGRIERGPCAELDGTCGGRVEATVTDPLRPLDSIVWVCQSHRARARTASSAGSEGRSTPRS